MSEEKEIEMYIDTEERYPIFSLVEPSKSLCNYFKRTRPKVKFTEKQLKEINDTIVQYNKIQKKLEKLAVGKTK